MDDIFNPKPKEIIIGSPNSNLFACGKNENTELSFKGYKYLNKPSGLKISKNQRIIQVSSGGNHTALVTEKGYLYMLGSTLHKKLGLDHKNVMNVSKPTLFPESKDSPVRQVSCGDYHTLALFQNGEVWSWGGTLHKKLGNRSSQPGPLKGFEKVVINKISCGDFHSVALSDKGFLFTWGGGGAHFNKGQLGHGGLDDISTPRPLKFFKNKPIHDFSCGGYHTMAICTEGDVYSWGSGTFGELGIGEFADSLTPKKVILDDSIIVTEISCGGHHSFLLTNEGKLFSCGKVAQGQIGHNVTENICVPLQVKNISKKDIVKVACGWNHTVALSSNGDIYCTGSSKYGELGLGTLKSRREFTICPGLTGKNINTVFAGGYHTWFLIDYDKPILSDYEAPSDLISNSPPKSLRNSRLKSISKSKKKDKLRKVSSNTKNIFSQKKLSQKSSKNVFKEDSDNSNDHNDYYNIPKSENVSRKSSKFIKANTNSFQHKKSYPQFNQKNMGSGNKNPFQINLDDSENESDNKKNELIDLDEDNVNIDLNNNLDDDIDNNDDKDYSIKKSDDLFNDEELSINSSNDLENQSADENFDDLDERDFNNRGNKDFDIIKVDKEDLNSDDMDEDSEMEDEEEDDDDFNNLTKKIEQRIKNSTIDKRGSKIEKNMDSEDENPDDYNFIPKIKKTKQNNFPNKRNSNKKKDNLQNLVKDLNIPRNDNNLEANIEILDTKSLDSINDQKREKSAYSSYHLIFTPLKYNHKYILIDYQLKNEQKIIDLIPSAIESIKKNDPKVMKCFSSKYDQFYDKDKGGVLKAFSSGQNDRGYETYVIMLIQTSESFENYFEEEEKYESDYEQIEFEDTSLGPMFTFHPEQLDLDPKWKILSKSYEILLNVLYDVSESVKIYELRAEIYK